MYLNCLSEGTNDSSIDGAVANSSKLSSSRYKGVVPQPNGRWGAQIYEKHRRVWLGTFNDEEEAAKAYYIASLRFRGIEAITNFKQNASISYTDGDEKDTLFLESHSKSEIVDMLRKHSYTNELETFKHKLHNAGDGEGGGKRIKCHIDFMNKCDQKEWLFEKVATPSDVGRLNRMVIPKQQAEKHFPLSAKFSDYHIHQSVPVYLAPEGGALSKGVLLNFEDDEGKVWRFRYCYWGSSQSYVLTKGWTRFVKEKKLKAGDVVLFLRSAGKDKKLFIECRPKRVDVSRFEEMMNPVEPLTTVQDYGAVRLFGVNIMETWSSCFERAPISLQFV